MELINNINNCIYCGKILPDKKSHKRKYCNAKCREAYRYRKDKEKRLKLSRAYYKIHREKLIKDMKIRSKEWYQKNKIKADKYKRLYYLENLDYYKKYNKEYYLKNKANILEVQKKQYSLNIDYQRERSKIKYQKNIKKLRDKYFQNREIILSKKRYYYQNNKEHIKERGKQYYLNNSSKIINYSKEYQKQHSKELNKTKKIYRKLKKINDKSYAISCRIRTLLNNAFHYYIKSLKIYSSKKYGIDIKAIIEHLKPFPEDISKYHVDHIKPLCSFKFIKDDDSIDLEEVKKAFAPENHQWLTVEENLRKGGRIISQ